MSDVPEMPSKELWTEAKDHFGRVSVPVRKLLETLTVEAPNLEDVIVVAQPKGESKLIVGMTKMSADTFHFMMTSAIDHVVMPDESKPEIKGRIRCRKWARETKS